MAARIGPSGANVAGYRMRSLRSPRLEPWGACHMLNTHRDVRRRETCAFMAFRYCLCRAVVTAPPLLGRSRGSSTFNSMALPRMRDWTPMGDCLTRYQRMRSHWASPIRPSDSRRTGLRRPSLTPVPEDAGHGAARRRRSLSTQRWPVRASAPGGCRRCWRQQWRRSRPCWRAGRYAGMIRPSPGGRTRAMVCGESEMRARCHAMTRCSKAVV
jgi:hypothetical protein